MGLLQAAKEKMDLTTGFMVQVGPHASMVYGGPFRRYIHGQRRLVGVKMAKEIDAQHDISIPTRDFSVPSVEAMQEGLIGAIDAIVTGHDIYVGCMGGIGRTGLFMGCLLKSLIDAGQFITVADDEDPVMLTRALYSGHAIETDEQMEYVREFPTGPVVEHINDILARYNKVVMMEVPVKVEVPMSPWQSIKHLLGFGH